VGLQTPKSKKIVNFWYKFVHNRYIPLSNFTKFGVEGGSSRPAPSCQISPLSLLKCGLTAPKIAKIDNFWYNFAKPLSVFLPNLAWERESLVRTHTPNFIVVALKMWVYSPQNREKNDIFLYEFSPKEKFRGSTEKVEYRCTTTILPQCNDTIIVLKITLLHSVSVITNFVIPKRDRQTKNITLFRLQPARDPRLLAAVHARTTSTGTERRRTPGLRAGC